MQILSQPREAVLLVCLCSAGMAPRALRMRGKCSLTGWDFWPLFYLPYICLWCLCMHLCVQMCVRSPVTSVYLISVATPACGFEGSALWPQTSMACPLSTEPSAPVPLALLGFGNLSHFETMLAWNSWSSCLSLPDTGIAGVSHHTLSGMRFLKIGAILLKWIIKKSSVSIF